MSSNAASMTLPELNKSIEEKNLKLTKEYVQMLERQAALKRLFVSEAATSLVDHVTSTQDEDPLFNQEKFKGKNPFNFKRKMCSIM